ncbi:hypothetical protein C8R46DRAFT_1199017 [Mycena filopes]|nr:hypothetical protein C8R46DRAFT_1199017 [Mycena filopes]
MNYNVKLTSKHSGFFSWASSFPSQTIASSSWSVDVALNTPTSSQPLFPHPPPSLNFLRAIHTSKTNINLFLDHSQPVTSGPSYDSPSRRVYTACTRITNGHPSRDRLRHRVPMCAFEFFNGHPLPRDFIRPPAPQGSNKLITDINLNGRDPLPRDFIRPPAPQGPNKLITDINLNGRDPLPQDFIRPPAPQGSNKLIPDIHGHPSPRDFIRPPAPQGSNFDYQAPAHAAAPALARVRSLGQAFRTHSLLIIIIPRVLKLITWAPSIGIYYE